MAREVAASQGNAETEDWLTVDESFTLASSGYVRQARIAAQHAVDLAQQASRKERAAGFEAGSAVKEALFGNGPEVSRFAKDALKLSDSRDLEYGAALVPALSHDSSESLRLAKDLERRFPEDTEVRFNYLPSLRALLALNGEPAQALQLLEQAASYELGTPPSSVDGFYGNLYPVYVRGLAYLSGHQEPQAALEFQRFLQTETSLATIRSALWRICNWAER